MDQDRIIRISFPGIAIIITILATNWTFGGTLFSFISDTKSFEILTKIAALVLTTPVLGFVISSIVHRFTEENKLFKIPNELLDNYRKALRTLAPYRPLNDEDFDKPFKSDVIMVHQAIIRSLMTEESLLYTTRRFTMFWTHRNLFWAILLGMIAGFLSAISDMKFGIESTSDLFVIKSSILIMLTFYLIAANNRASYNLKQSNLFEINWIIWKADSL